MISQPQWLLGVDQVQLDQGNLAMLGQRCLELAALRARRAVVAVVYLFAQMLSAAEPSELGR